MKRILVYNDELISNNFNVATMNTIMVTLGNREDYPEVCKFKLLNESGIYILFNDNRLYIGQSINLKDRISQHTHRKDWWTKFITISYSDEINMELDKGQLDYLEATLINYFKSKNVLLDNISSGNTSYIDNVKKYQARQLLLTGLDIILNVFNCRFAENSSYQKKLKKTCQIEITNNDGKVETYKANNYRNLLYGILQKYAHIEETAVDLYLDIADEANKNNLLSNHNYHNSNKTRKLNDDLYMYIDISDKAALKWIDYYMSLLKIKKYVIK